MTHLRKVDLGKGELVNDAWGIPKFSKAFSLFHGTFTFNIPPSWFVYENAAQVPNSLSTVVTSVGGEAKITTTAALTNNYMESRECPRYQPNRGHLFSTALRCDNPTADMTREWGLATAENKILFRLKADGLLYAVLVSGSVTIKEEEIDTTVIPGFDVSKGQIYDIQYQWRGAGNYFFYIGDPTTGQSKLVHTFGFLGTLTAVSIENPALPMCFKATRTTEDGSIFVGCADITSENGGQIKTAYASALAEAVVTGTDTPVLVVKQPAQINGVTNTRSIVALRLSVVCDKKATFKVWITRDPTAIIGATFKPMGNGSFIETDSPDMDPTAVRATSVDLTKLLFFTSLTAPALVRSTVESPFGGEIRITLVRGDFLVVTCTSQGAGSADAIAEWGEEH